VSIISFLRPTDPRSLRAQAETAAQEGNLAKAITLWQKLNSTSNATASTLLSESRACLVQGLAAQAERSLHRAVAADPTEIESWLLLLKILRVEDRLLDALHFGWTALVQVAPTARVELLRELTLLTLTDLKDEIARTLLQKWIDADPTDVDARVALLRRIEAEPRSEDPDRDVRLAVLSKLMAEHPNHVGVREALVTALADAGEQDRGRILLDSWPVDERDGRYWRLLGRWYLEHDQMPEQAIKALQAAIIDFPHDWRIHYRLARALKIVGRTEEARHEAEAVTRIRELLDPLFLEPRLEMSFTHLDQPAARQVLANLCTKAGLTHLAKAWNSIKLDQPVRTIEPEEMRAGSNGAKLLPELRR
jgi:tetratricopeptide (TPR) repeat protein